MWNRGEGMIISGENLGPSSPEMQNRPLVPIATLLLTALLSSGCAGSAEPPVLGTPAPAASEPEPEPEPEMLSVQERRAAPFRTVSSGGVVPHRSTVAANGAGEGSGAADADGDGATTDRARSRAAAEPVRSGDAAAGGAGRTHRVEWGQTWFGIARLYSVTREALAAANPGVDPELLRAGDVLQIPGGAGARTHTVGSGDTLWNISRRYGVELAALRSANGIEGNEIRIGQVLIIPEG